MTCIVGLEVNGGVIIGGDSAGVAGYSITGRADEKVWADGDWAFGFTSSFRMGQILRYSFTPPPVHTWDVDRYMATDFVDALRSTLRDKGWMRSDGGADSGGFFLAGYRDRLYLIASDFQIGRSRDGYQAVGCGEDLALGSLHSTRPQYGVTFNPEPDERVQLALAAAAYHSAGVCGPFVIASNVPATVPVQRDAS